MHSLYWLDFSDFRQETHFQHRFFSNSGTREPAEAATWCLRPPFVQSPGGNPNRGQAGSDGKHSHGSKSPGTKIDSPS